MVNLALFFLVLAPVVAIAYLVWAYRKRSAARVAASSDRFARIFEPGAQRSATATAPAGTASLDEAAASAIAPRGLSPYVRRAGLLSAGHARLRDALRTALPAHEVFAHVSLASLIELTGVPEGRERDQRLRALAQQTADCVVCDKTFSIVAVVDIESGQSADRQFKAECLRAAGVRYLRWHADEIPRSGEIAALIAEQ